MTPDPIFIFNLVTSLCNFGVQGFVLISLFTIAYRRKSNVPFYLAMTSLFLLITLLSMVIAYATGVLLAQEINIIQVIASAASVLSLIFLIRFIHTTFDFPRERGINILTALFVILAASLLSFPIIVVFTGSTQSFLVFAVLTTFSIDGNLIFYVIIQIQSFKLMGRLEKGTPEYKAAFFIFIFGLLACVSVTGITLSYAMQDIGVIFGITWLTTAGSTVCAYLGFIFPRHLKVKQRLPP